jgi:hypothetical protein
LAREVYGLAQACKEHLKDILDSESCADLLRGVGEIHRPDSAIDGSHRTVSPIVSGADFLAYASSKPPSPRCRTSTKRLSRWRHVHTVLLSVFGAGDRNREKPSATRIAPTT